MSHVSQHRTDSARYAKCVEVSKRIRWDTDRDVIRGRAFDFAKPFLPDGLSKASQLTFLTKSLEPHPKDVFGMGDEEYRREVVDEVVALLRGEGGEEHLHALVLERKRLAQALEFEAAARLRDLIAGIERVRLARSVVSGEGAQAVVAPSTEPGIIEVFVLTDGRLVAHRGFEADDRVGLTLFAREALERYEKMSPDGRKGSNEARIVAAYLRRRSGVVEAVRLGEAADLLRAAERVVEAVGEPEVPLG